MKKSFLLPAFAVLISLALVLSGCSNAAKAKTSVNLMFTVYHQGDTQAVENLIEQYTESISVNPVPDAASDLLSGILPSTDVTLAISGKVVAAMIKKTMDNISWSIKSTRTVDDHEIIVTTDVTNLDMKSISSKYAVKIGEFTLTTLFSGYSESERTQKYLDILDEVVEANKEDTLTRTLDIKVKKINGQWQVIMSDEIIDAMTGGMLSMYNGVLDILGQIDDYFKTLNYTH